MPAPRPDRRPPEMPIAAHLPLAGASREAPQPVQLAPEAAELPAIARFLALAGLEEFAFTGELAPWGERGWRVTGTLAARYSQRCVVSLEPVEEVREIAVDRRFLPAEDLPPPGDEEVEIAAEDEPDPVGDGIDLAALLLESLALALEPYPRHAGAEFGSRVFAPPGTAPLTDEAMRPFAKLAALKSRLEDGGE